MGELGIILIGTGLIVFFTGHFMVRSTRKLTSKTTFINDQEDVQKQKERASKTEQEFMTMVRKSMWVLYVVGITCILIGILLIAFGV